MATGFRFRLAPRTSEVQDFTLEWDDPAIVRRMVREWRTHFPGDRCEELTSFCRVSVTGDEGGDPPVLIGGAFVGDPDALCDTLKRMLPNTFEEAKTDVCAPQEARPRRAAAASFTHPGYQPGPPVAALRRLESLAGVSDSDLSQTCAGIPYPHKVSSCFPRPGFGDDGDRAITEFVSASAHLPEARLYLSLHCMGGAVGRGGERSSFAYRDRPFMLQYQAWWAHPGDHEVGERCLRWVRDFRKAMRGHTEGAFINFPDVDLVPDPETPAGRLKLLRFYYGGNLDALIGIKSEWDPDNVLDFEMGIPTSG